MELCPTIRFRTSGVFKYELVNVVHCRGWRHDYGLRCHPMVRFARDLLVKKGKQERHGDSERGITRAGELVGITPGKKRR
jgi:hypothetical protein